MNQRIKVAYFSNFPGFSNHVKSIQIQRGIGTFSNGTANYGGSINFESDKLESKPSFAINSGFRFLQYIPNNNKNKHR